MAIAKKVWAVSGNFSENKEALKETRTQLNHDAGVVEKEVDQKSWPHHITKGPDHPHLSPFFREVRIGQEFHRPGFDVVLKKVDFELVKNTVSGAMGVMSPDLQVRLA